MRALIILLVALGGSIGSASAQDLRMSKAERLAVVLGIDRDLADAQVQVAASAKERAKLTIEGIRKVPNAPPEMVEMASRQVEEMTQQIVHSWDPNQAARIFCDGLVDQFSEEELSAMETYYASPGGKKAYSAISASRKKMQEYISSRVTAATTTAMNEYLVKVQECLKGNCGPSKSH